MSKHLPRIAWLVTALLSTCWIVYLLSGTIGTYSLGCGKTATLEHYDGISPSATCTTSAFDALDTSISVKIIVLLVAPAVVAALADRVWVSVIAVFAIVPWIVIGVTHWADYWSLLAVGGIPIFGISLVAAAIHLGVHSYGRRRAHREAHRETEGSLFDGDGRSRLFRS